MISTATRSPHCTKRVTLFHTAKAPLQWYSVTLEHKALGPAVITIKCSSSINFYFILV